MNKLEQFKTELPGNFWDHGPDKKKFDDIFEENLRLFANFQHFCFVNLMNMTKESIENR